MPVISVVAATLLVAACSSPGRQTKSDDSSRPPTKLLVHRVAYVSRINGKVLIRLAKPTGTKEIDDAAVAKLMSENKGFPDLKEGVEIQLYGEPEEIR